MNFINFTTSVQPLTYLLTHVIVLYVYFIKKKSYDIVYGWKLLGTNKCQTHDNQK